MTPVPIKAFNNMNNAFPGEAVPCGTCSICSSHKEASKLSCCFSLFIDAGCDPGLASTIYWLIRRRTGKLKKLEVFKYFFFARLSDKRYFNYKRILLVPVFLFSHALRAWSDVYLNFIVPWSQLPSLKWVVLNNIREYLVNKFERKK